MKKATFTLIMLIIVVFATAQPPQKADAIQLDVNTLSNDESARINQFIERQRSDGRFWTEIGMAVLGSVVSRVSSVGVSEIMKLTEIPKKQKAEWTQMIQNECNYQESLSYINNLTDFYSKGSTHGALDPSDFNFNGFTLHAQHNGKDVLRFYCHVNTEEDGLYEIVNHSKFRLVLDSMYFYPYQCHLPNLAANHIIPKENTTYERSTSFNFEERDNLIVNISFTITSSWYNQAIQLAKDVELGTFSIKIPIDQDHLTDGVFVYKRGMPDQQPMDIAGSCFIVPRSFMPLSEGKKHWGTGEYNVKVTVEERCGITPEISDNWKKDYRLIKKMKTPDSIWPAFKEFFVQEGNSLLRCSLNTASSTAIGQWEWLNSNGSVTRGAGSGTGGGKIPGGK